MILCTLYVFDHLIGVIPPRLANNDQNQSLDDQLLTPLKVELIIASYT